MCEGDRIGSEAETPQGMHEGPVDRLGEAY